MSSSPKLAQQAVPEIMQCFPLVFGRMEVQLSSESHARDDVKDLYEKLEALIHTTRQALVEYETAGARHEHLHKTLRIAMEVLRWSNGGCALPPAACALVVDFVEKPAVTICIPRDLHECRVTHRGPVSGFMVIPFAAWRRTAAAFEEAVVRRLQGELTKSDRLRIHEAQFQAKVEMLSTALRRPLWATAHVVNRPLVDVRDAVVDRYCISELESDEEDRLLEDDDDEHDATDLPGPV